MRNIERRRERKMEEEESWRKRERRDGGRKKESKRERVAVPLISFVYLVFLPTLRARL